MLKQLFRDGVVYSMGHAVGALLGILLLPIFTAHLSPADFGLYDMGMVVVMLAGLVVALEIAQGAARYYCDADDAEARRQYFSTALLFTLGAFAVFGGIGTVAAPLVTERLLGPDANPTSFRLVVAAAGTIAVHRLALAQLRWLLRPWAYLSSSLAQLSVTATSSVWLVSEGYGAHGLFVGVIVGRLVGFVVALWSGRAGFGLTWSRAHLRHMLAFSLPLMASSAAVFVATSIDRVVIKEMLTMADLGLYGVAYRFAAAVRLVMAGFNTALMPLIYTHYRDPETPVQLEKLLRRVFLVGAAVIIGLAGFAPDALRLLTSSEYESAAALVPSLAAAALLMTMQNVAPGLWIAERTRLIAAINLVVALLNLGLNLMIIPTMGIRGAALATLAAAAIGFGLNVAASQKHYHVPHRWIRLALGVGGTVVAVALLEALGRKYEPISMTGLGIKSAVVVAAIALASFSVLTSRELRGFLAALRPRRTRER